MRFREFLKEELNRDQLQKMQRINRKMEQNPAMIDELWNTVSRKVQDGEGNLNDRILKALQPENTKPETDQTFANTFIDAFVAAIDKTEGTVEEKIQFANTLGSVNHIDTKALLQPLAGWSDWLVGTPFAIRLFDTMFNLPAFRTDNKGPGEVALALLSPKITLSKTKGDIVVDGRPIELKGGKSASGGRLSPTKGTLGMLHGNKDFWKNLVPDDPDKGAELAKVNKINANNYSSFLEKYGLDEKQSEIILGAIFKVDGLDGLIASAAKKSTGVTAADLVAIAVKNYGLSQGDEHFLILQSNIRSSLYFYVDDLSPILNRLSFSLPLIDSDARSQGQAQIGILSKSR